MRGAIYFFPFGATGDSGNISGSSSAVLSDVSASCAGGLFLAAQATANLSRLESVSSGNSGLAGISSGLLDTVSCIFSGDASVSGVSTIFLEAIVFQGFGSVAVACASSNTLGQLAQNFSGQLGDLGPLSGFQDATLGDAVMAAAGSLFLCGFQSSTFESFAQRGEGLLHVYTLRLGNVVRLPPETRLFRPFRENKIVRLGTELRLVRLS